MCKSVVRPAMFCAVCLWRRNGGSDGRTSGKNGSCRVENGEMGSRSGKKGNDCVRGTAKIAKLEDKLRDPRLRWYGLVKRKEGTWGKKNDGDGGAR